MDSYNIQEEQSYPTPYASSPLLPLLLMSLATQRYLPRETTTTFKKEYDYIIVGAGSAGSVVASRLSELPCISVLLLEAGKRPPILTEVPAIPRCFINTTLDWQYFTTPQKHAAYGHVDKKVPWPSGKVVGGTSILGENLYTRGNKKNYDDWEMLGAKGWCYEEVLPYFRKLENNTDPVYLANRKYHAAGGPITVSRPAYNPVKKHAVAQAARNEGYEFEDVNAETQIGFYDFQVSLRGGQRCSTAKAYLVPAENRTNLDILPNAMVRKVLIENKIFLTKTLLEVKKLIKKTAVGVEFDFEGKTHRVTAKREVILSAGTINTAQLLMLSGIGPRLELRKFNISVHADLPVGRNFQEAPAATIIYTVNDSLPQFDAEVREDRHIENYINNRKGPLTSAEGFHLMAFLSKPGSIMKEIPNFILYFADLLSLQILQIGLNERILKEVVYPLANKSLLICGSQALDIKSIGSVTLQSADPNVPPLIDPNYYSDVRDLDNVVEGLKICQQIMSNDALKKIDAKPIEQIIPGCEDCTNDPDLYTRCLSRTIVFTTTHQVGTAKMGNPSDLTTVVDPQLRVKGICGLRVVDASIMPTQPFANTNIPTIMVAEKGSDIIKETIRCPK